MAALLTWAFMGIRFGHSLDWQIVVSNAQAIFTYVFDSLLMRQQLNGYDSILIVSACLKSRNVSNRRMLREIIESERYRHVKATGLAEPQDSEIASELPIENWLGRMSTTVSKFIGHIVVVCLFWVCIFIWIGLGHYCSWSTRWQLYINSATSALMVFVFAFLANIRERHSKYTERCLNSIYKVDSSVELSLRTLTGHTLPNPTVSVPGPQVTRIQRAIFYYADVVGTLVGIALLALVIITWVAVGSAMSWDSNWYLLIGTFAGLVGMNDGFVLRNVDSKLRSHENAQFEELKFDDLDILSIIGVSQLPEEHVVDSSFSCRLSIRMGAICSHEMTVVLGVCTIVGLIIGASAMRWTITGQLLCNIPPSIIESFFMIILVTGHNIADSRRRVDLHNMHSRRLKLFCYVNSLVLAGVQELQSKTVSPINSSRTEQGVMPDASGSRIAHIEHEPKSEAEAM
ncbi:low-affinity Fe(2+) transport protein [Hypocenomyce scalaris]|nr:low-affinity Fe(2+) transport protein [Hypocenomyce scalaris]